jgi:shikimate dehydrogenase
MGVHLNATTIGLPPETEAHVPIDTVTLRPGLIVSGVIASPPLANLVRDTHERGCVVLDGLGILEVQGINSIRLWTGRDPRHEVMYRALVEVLATRTSTHGFFFRKRVAT